VSLLHRSRFYLAFRGRETFYYEAEHRRLCYLRSQLEADPDADPDAARGTRKRAEKAIKRLEVRRARLQDRQKQSASAPSAGWPRKIARVK
jgi:Domain of unknown function (DUF3490)